MIAIWIAALAGMVAGWLIRARLSRRNWDRWYEGYLKEQADEMMKEN